MTQSRIGLFVVLLGFAVARAAAQLPGEVPAVAGGRVVDLRAGAAPGSEAAAAPPAAPAPADAGAAAPGPAGTAGAPLAAGQAERRDPFRPFIWRARGEKDQEPRPVTPLERYELRELTVTAILLNLSPPRALVQDSARMGYIITPGTLIGKNGGVVAAIEPKRIIVEEKTLDYQLREQITRQTLEMADEDRPQDAKRERK